MSDERAALLKLNAVLCQQVHEATTSPGKKA